jgi:hypothetical protein
MRVGLRHRAKPLVFQNYLLGELATHGAYFCSFEVEMGNGWRAFREKTVA